jgi:hypothetical protein
MRTPFATTQPMGPSEWPRDDGPGQVRESSMITLHCIACGGDGPLSWDGGPITCACGRSRASFDDGTVELHGPCVARWFDGLVTSGMPRTDPLVRRKNVPPLL